MNNVPTYGEDQPTDYYVHHQSSCTDRQPQHQYQNQHQQLRHQPRRRRRLLFRIHILLSIFIVHSTIFVALILGHAMTVSSFVKSPTVTSHHRTLTSNYNSSNRAQSNSESTTSTSSLLCPLPDPNSLDPWACDLDRAERQLAVDKDVGDGRLCRSRPSSSSTSSSPSSKINNNNVADQFIKIVSPIDQCLIISDPSTHVRELCREGPVFRRDRSGQFVLSFCHQYSLLTLSDGSTWMSANFSTCKSILRPILDEIKRKDAQARRLSCEFDSLLARYNCQSGYSVKWSCDDCSKVYRSWTCSIVMPFFDEGRPRKPCRSFCQHIEQTCPYFHPSHRDQYAGEPAFICIDPVIPFIPSLTPVVPFDDSLECYDECDLEYYQHNCSLSSRSKTENSALQNLIRDCKRRIRDRDRKHHHLMQRSSTVTSSPSPSTLSSSSSNLMDSSSNSFDSPFVVSADDDSPSMDELSVIEQQNDATSSDEHELQLSPLSNNNNSPSSPPSSSSVSSNVDGRTYGINTT